MKGLAFTLNTTLVKRSNLISGDSLLTSSNHRNRQKSLCSGSISIFKSDFSVSAVTTTSRTLNLSKMPSRRGLNEGPTCRQSFKLGPNTLDEASSDLLLLVS